MSKPKVRSFAHMRKKACIRLPYSAGGAHKINTPADPMAA